MSLVNELSHQKKIYASCPSCGEDFPLGAARLFDATKKLPKYAVAYLEAQELALKQGLIELKKRQERAKSKPRLAAESVGIGKVVEKIAPSLPGFPVNSADCRSLFEPIDYIVFQGLARTGKVEAIHFVDVKSGAARLSAIQQDVRRVVEAGRVRMLIVPRPSEEVT